MSLLLLVLLVSPAQPSPKPKADAGTRAVSPQTFRRPAVITGDKLTVLGSKHEADWLGHVHVSRDTTRITCDKLVAHYTGEQEVTHIQCEGNVEALDGDKKVRGEHADFDNETGILIMTGEPWVEIWDGKTHLKGKKATFLTGEDRMDVVGDVTTVIDEKQRGTLPKTSPRDAGT